MGASSSVLGGTKLEDCTVGVQNRKKLSNLDFGGSIWLGYCRYCTNNSETTDFFFLDGINTSCCDSCSFRLESRLRASRRVLTCTGNAREGLTLLSMFEHLRMVSYCRRGCGCNQTNNDSTSCTVCYKDFDDKMLRILLPCGHTFCKECIVRWLLDQRSCKPSFVLSLYSYCI
jgi:hypothetical protein